MPRVLIVEDETVLRASMARALAKLPAEVVEAGTVAEAVAALGHTIPDVIVSDLDLPDGTGIELIGELGRRRARVPVVFVSAYLRAFRAQIPPHADVEVREKPLALDELRALVRERIAAGDSDTEIRAYFRERYGDFVLFRPPWDARTWGLWLAPVILAGLGITALFTMRRPTAPLEPEEGDR